MAAKFTINNISQLILKHITVSDDLQNIVEKTNYNFDQVIQFTGKDFLDKIKNDVFNSIKNGEGNIKFLGKPGATGIGKPGVDGKSGSQIYVSEEPIPDNEKVINPSHKENDVIIDRTTMISKVFKIVDGNNIESLIYRNNFRINSSILNVLINQYEYNSDGVIIDKFIIEDFTNVTPGVSNMILVTKSGTSSNFFRLSLGIDRLDDIKNGTINISNIIVDKEETAESEFLPQITLKHRRRWNSGTSYSYGTISYKENYESLLSNIVEYDTIDISLLSNNGISISSFARDENLNTIFYNTKNNKFIGNSTKSEEGFFDTYFNILVDDDSKNVTLFSNKTININSLTKRIITDSNFDILESLTVGNNATVSNLLTSDKVDAKIGIRTPSISAILENGTLTIVSISLFDKDVNFNSMISVADDIVGFGDLNISGITSLSGGLKINVINSITPNGVIAFNDIVEFNKEVRIQNGIVFNSLAKFNEDVNIAGNLSVDGNTTLNTTFVKVLRTSSIEAQGVEDLKILSKTLLYKELISTSTISADKFKGNILTNSITDNGSGVVNFLSLVKFSNGFDGVEGKNYRIGTNAIYHQGNINTKAVSLIAKDVTLENNTFFRSKTTTAEIINLIGVNPDNQTFIGSTGTVLFNTSNLYKNTVIYGNKIVSVNDINSTFIKENLRLITKKTSTGANILSTSFTDGNITLTPESFGFPSFAAVGSNKFLSDDGTWKQVSSFPEYPTQPTPLVLTAKNGSIGWNDVYSLFPKQADDNRNRFLSVKANGTPTLSTFFTQYDGIQIGVGIENMAALKDINYIKNDGVLSLKADIWNSGQVLQGYKFSSYSNLYDKVFTNQYITRKYASESTTFNQDNKRLHYNGMIIDMCTERDDQLPLNRNHIAYSVSSQNCGYTTVNSALTLAGAGLYVDGINGTQMDSLAFGASSASIDGHFGWVRTGEERAGNDRFASADFSGTNVLAGLLVLAKVYKEGNVWKIAYWQNRQFTTYNKGTSGTVIPLSTYAKCTVTPYGTARFVIQFNQNGYLPDAWSYSVIAFGESKSVQDSPIYCSVRDKKVDSFMITAQDDASENTPSNDGFTFMIYHTGKYVPNKEIYR